MKGRRQPARIGRCAICSILPNQDESPRMEPATEDRLELEAAQGAPARAAVQEVTDTSAELGLEFEEQERAEVTRLADDDHPDDRPLVDSVGRRFVLHPIC